MTLFFCTFFWHSMNMKFRYALIFVFVFALSVCVRAQGKAVAVCVKQTVRGTAERVVARKLLEPRLPAAQAAYWKSLQRAGDFSGVERMLGEYFVLDPARAPSAEWIRRSTALQEKSVLNYLERQLALSKLQPAPVLDAVAGSIHYLNYIPVTARVVMLGEVHEIDWMVNETERAVYQYQKAYPERNVYYASEFADASVGEIIPLHSKADVELRVRKRPYYRAVTERLIRAGVNVVGLENPTLSDELVKRGYGTGFADTELAWRSVSPMGMETRNLYWAEIIRRILLEDPSAVVFVHAGLGHTDYNQPSALPWLLKEFRPYVVEFTEPGIGDFNTLLEDSSPIFPIAQKARKLAAENPGKTVRIIRHFPFKKTAVAVGCDLNVRRLSLTKEY